METTLNKIQKVWFSDNLISIETKSGIVKSHPLHWFPRLEKATVEQRNNFELSHFGIHWPELDEDLSFEGFFTFNKDEVEAQKSEIQKVFAKFPELNISELARRIGISPTLMRHYACNVKHPSPERTQQIIEALHQVGRELIAV